MSERWNNKLSRVEPFTWFWYRSCLYHQMIAGYSQFGVEPGAFLSQGLGLYAFEEGNPCASFRFRDLMDEREFEKYSGVHLVKRRDDQRWDLPGGIDSKICRSIDMEICRSIDRGCPVIVAVDNFGLAHRREYRTTHGLHFLLVFGYDRAAGEYDAVEHDFVNSLNYVKRRLPIANVLEGASMQRENPNYHDFYLMKLVKKSEYDREGLMLQMRRRYDDVLNLRRGSLDALTRYVGRLKELTQRREDFFREVALHRDFLINMRQKKACEQYQLSYLYGDEALSKQCGALANDFVFVSAILHKLSFHKEVFDETVSVLKSRLDRILDRENGLLEFYAGRGEEGQIWNRRSI